jgi:hypothetical protein
MTETPITKTEIDGTSAEFVNVIMLWRIYDALLLILNQLGGDAASLGKMHEQGEFIGPMPSVSVEEDNG